MKNINLELTPFEAETLHYILEKRSMSFMLLSGSNNSAVSRIKSKLIFRLKQKGLI
jgi:hypothetical protein